MTDRFYVLGPYENNDRHSICRESQTGGDPWTIVTIAGIHRPDDLYRLCDLANKQVEASALPSQSGMPSVTNEMISLACEVYSEVYHDDDKDMGDAMRAALESALRSLALTNGARETGAE